MEQRWFNSSSKKHLTLYCPFSKSCLYLDGEPPEKVLAERNYLRTRVVELEGAVDFGTDILMFTWTSVLIAKAGIFPHATILRNMSRRTSRMAR